MNRVVLSAPNEALLQPACDRLAANGIAFRVNGSALTSLRGALPFADASVTIEVLRDEDVEIARSLLATNESEGDEGSWVCAGCGEDCPGNFETCWKCGAVRLNATPAATASPYRGERPAPEEIPSPLGISPATRRAQLRDLLWSIGVGCIPVALTVLGSRSLMTVFPDWSIAREAGIVNLAAGLELAVCLRLSQRRGTRLGDLWGGRERWLPDLFTALMFAGMLYVAERAIHGSLRGIAGAPTGTIASARRPLGDGVDLFLLTAGIAVSAATGTLWLCGIVQRQARGAFHSGIAAALVASAAGTVMWSPTARLPIAASVFVGQLILCGGSIVAGRIWPLAIAAAGSAFIRWVVFFSR